MMNDFDNINNENNTSNIDVDSLKNGLINEANSKQSKTKNKKIKKQKKSWSKKKKIVLTSLFSIFIVGACTGLILLYGPYDGFRDWLITTAMTTKDHQYLATWFYDDETIQKTLAKHRVIESGENTNYDSLSVPDYNALSYANEYERAILEKDKNQQYKLISIKEDNFRGYLVAIYNPSKVKMVTTKKLGSSGQMLVDMAVDNNAVIAMNANGFYDPGWNSTGGDPYGTVISNNKIVWQGRKGKVGGGMVGFNSDNKLILNRLSGQDALNAGIRDGVQHGPFLIVNGKPSFIEGNGGWGTAPRTAIGQREDGIVLFLVIDGRQLGSVGASMVDLTRIMQNYGAINAVNMDGGTSSGLVIDGELINKPVNGNGDTKTRPIPTAWILTD